MIVKLSVRKSLEENATTYFEAAKKARKKLEGAKKAVEKLQKALPEKQPRLITLKRRKEWYEQYRWTYSIDGTLIIAGKDATSNEVIIKKHTESTDTVLHTDIPGSPFVVIKGPATDQVIEAAGQLCAAYSKAWKAGLAAVDVFAVAPDQVSKTPNTGEFLGKGSFVIRGEKRYQRVSVTISIGLIDGRPTAGLPALFEHHHASFFTLKPGPDKPSDVAKKLAKKLSGTIDEWLALLPAGGSAMTTHKKTVNAVSPEEKR